MHKTIEAGGIVMKIRDMVPVGWHKEDLFGPESRFDSFQKETKRFFDGFSQSMFNLAPMRPGWWSSFAEVMPHMDVYEDSDAVEITAELPGMDEKDITISLSHGILTIKGEKKAERKIDRKDYFRMERSYGSFQRSIPIHFDIEKDKIDASFKKGVLTIKLPKDPKAKGEGAKIAVRTE